MTRTTKICLVGDFGVGKTSLVRRFVRQAFSEKYQTTVGVTIETKELALPDGEEVKLVIWDIAGSRVVDSVKKTYLTGASGLLYVIDGTRAETLDAARALEGQALTLLPHAAQVFLFNKSDLGDRWELDDARCAAVAGRHPSFLTSAKTGVNVEAAFTALARAAFRA